MMDLVKKTGSLKLHYEVNDIIAKVSLLIKEAVQVISKVYNLTEEEVNILVNQIDYLISSKAVKKIASSAIAFNYVKKKVFNTSS